MKSDGYTPCPDDGRCDLSYGMPLRVNLLLRRKKNTSMLKVFILVTATIFLAGGSRAQHHDDAEEMPSTMNEPLHPDDSLKRVLHDLGKFEGHFRSYFMNTVNASGNPDYYALAAGGGLAYYSPVIRNVQVGISGFIIYNLASSSLHPEGGYVNRYELALFDIADPGNRKDLDRLEDLYLRYYLNAGRRSFLQIGKFHLSTPLMNPQDTRMRPNLQEGLWAEFREWDHLKFRGGWLWSTSPRGTVEWYGIGESVGIYNGGKAVNGATASYGGHVESKRILVGNLEWHPVKDANYSVWNYHVDNLFNIAVQQLEVKRSFTRKTWQAGLQYLWQRSLAGGGLPPENQYITPGEQSHVLSGRIALTGNGAGDEWSLNYTRVTAHGRFLFPREWGTETLYTYNSRERNEGAGDVHAVMLGHKRYLDRGHRLSFRGRGGLYTLPAITNSRLNKYSMPSYYHLSVEAGYKFRGLLKGLQTQMLYAYKGNLDGDFQYEPAAIQNKTNLHHLSLRMDYYF